MKTMLRAMQKKGNGIPGEILPVFEGIIQKYEAQDAPSLGDECDKEFVKAMEEHLTKEQRFRLYEQNGSCRGTGYDAERKAFAHKYAHMPLAKRLELFEKTFNRAKAVLNDDDTITVKFACTHGYYRQARLAHKGTFQLPESIDAYFERCAGGRLYEYQKALGIKLKIKTVDVSPLYENALNPVEFVFEILE